jgi:hypothetical protein
MADAAPGASLPRLSNKNAGTSGVAPPLLAFATSPRETQVSTAVSRLPTLSAGHGLTPRSSRLNKVERRAAEKRLKRAEMRDWLKT